MYSEKQRACSSIHVLYGNFYVDVKVTGTCVYLEITVTRFMQPMPILTPPSTKLFLWSNPFRPTHIL